MTGALTEATGKDGRCRICGAKLGLLQRMSKQEFCSPAHRDQFLRMQERLALACLQEAQSSDEESRKPLEYFVAPSVDLREVLPAPPARTEAGPVSAFAENAAHPAPQSAADPDPGEAGFLGFDYRIIPAAAVPMDREAESPSTILPATALPRLACAAAEFAWEAAHGPEQARMESAREAEETARVPLDPPPPVALVPSTTAGWKLPSPEASTLTQGEAPAKESPARSLAIAAKTPGSEESAPPRASSLFPLTAPLARAMSASMPWPAEGAPHGVMLPPAMAPGATAPQSALPAATVIGTLVGRTHPYSLSGPPAPRKGMQAKLGVRDPGAEALLDPLPCPFGGVDQAWQPEL